VLLTVEEEVSTAEVKIVVPVLEMMNILASHCFKFESMSASPNLVFINDSAHNWSQEPLIIQLANNHAVGNRKSPCGVVPLNFFRVACHKFVSSIKKFCYVTAHILLKREKAARVELRKLS
jgi:hypothetical protein